MTATWVRTWGVMRLELLAQRREPLVWLCALVLGVVAGAFAAAGPIELVQGRGAVPRTAPWSLALACTAIAAFGQVLTTMVSATAVLRDDAVRLTPLLAGTRLTHRERVLGKLGATCVILCAVYAAVPIAIIVGAWWQERHAVGVSAVLVQWLTLILPVMLSVAALQVGVAAFTGRLWAVVGTGLILLWFWTLSIDAARSPGASVWALALDPFGSAPLLAVTRSWTDAQRIARPVPLTEAFLLGRVAWGAVACTVLVAAALRGAAPTAQAAPRVRAEQVAVSSAEDGWAPGVRAPRAAVVVRSSALLTWRWIVRDSGFRVLLLLCALNVGIHTWVDVTASAHVDTQRGAAFRALLVHSRLFLILLATIYAGELVWRAREVRLSAMLDATPGGHRARALGDLLGTLGAQAGSIIVLVLLVHGVASVAARHWLATPSWTVAMLLSPGAVFAVWMLASVVVHVLIPQKVLAHLVLIAAWTVAVALSSSGPEGVWRTLDWPWPAAVQSARAPVPIGQAVGLFTAVAVGLGMAAVVLGRRGDAGRAA